MSYDMLTCLKWTIIKFHINQMTNKQIGGWFIGILNFPEIQSISRFIVSVTAGKQRKMTHVATDI